VPQSSGIILRTVDSSFFNAPPKAHPSNIYVVSYNDGRIRAFTGAPSAVDRWGSRFCYIVDTAERRVSASFSMPSSTDAYSFTTEVEATWKVTNAEAVVRANLSDGNEVVLARLRDELWMVGRQFRPEDAARAETAARSALMGLRDLDEGITILRSTARFRVDTHLTSAELERDHDRHEGGLEEQKMLRLRRMVEGSDEAMVMLHLMRHPDDTGTVLQMIADARDKNQAVQLGLLDRMLEHNLITDADAQPLRDSVLGRIAPPVTMRAIAPRTPPALPGTASPAQPRTAEAPQKVYAVEDIPASAQSGSIQPANQPSSAEPGAPATLTPPPPAGGVKKWKSVKKSPGQDPE
jgi:hypothetical protein